MSCYIFSRSLARWPAPALASAACCLMLASVVTLPGCGRGDAPQLGQVTGVVTLDGQPLPEAQVEFLPASGRPSSAETGQDGRYRLRYSADFDGALVGPHTVKIHTAVDGRVDRQKELVPPRYHAQSELSAEVKSGSNTFNFDLQSK